MSGFRAALTSVCFYFLVSLGEVQIHIRAQAALELTNCMVRAGLRLRAVSLPQVLRAQITGTTVPSSFLSSTEWRVQVLRSAF